MALFLAIISHLFHPINKDIEWRERQTKNNSTSSKFSSTISSRRGTKFYCFFINVFEQRFCRVSTPKFYPNVFKIQAIFSSQESCSSRFLIHNIKVSGLISMYIWIKFFAQLFGLVCGTLVLKEYVCVQKRSNTLCFICYSINFIFDLFVSRSFYAVLL